MRRVLVVGRGGAGKSTFARELGSITGLPIVELDAHFWQPGASPLDPESWAVAQQALIEAEAWIVDGDLGPYDSALRERVRAADTIVLLDYPLRICVWRALRRGRRSIDFWRWVLGYRHAYLPHIHKTLARHGSGARIHVLGHPREATRFLASHAS